MNRLNLQGAASRASGRSSSGQRLSLEPNPETDKIIQQLKMKNLKAGMQTN